MTIRPLPVVLSELKFGGPVMRTGAPFDATYKSSGDTTATAVVRNGAGMPVRSLAAGLAVPMGSRSLTWDGRDDGGQPLPDGPYTLTLASRDVHGLESSAAAGVVLDGTGPDARVTSPLVIAPDQAVTVAFADPAGVAEASVTQEGRGTSASLERGQNTVTLKPYVNWTEGTHNLTLYARDGVGNERRIPYSFQARKGGAPAPPSTGVPNGGGGNQATGTAVSMACTKASAKQAVIASKVFNRPYERFLGQDASGSEDEVFDTFSVWKVWCKDFNRDGRRDMAVNLACCTVTSPRPLVVFLNTTRGWRVGWQRFSSNAWDPKRVGSTLRYKTPVYRRADANCCPSRFRYYKLSYRAGKMRLTRVKAPHGR